MCEVTGHARCDLGQLQFDYPSWTLTDRLLPKIPGYDEVHELEARRGAQRLVQTGEGRFGRMRAMLIRAETGCDT